MVTLLACAIILSTALSIILFARSISGHAATGGSFPFAAVLFTIWLISAAMWGRWFHVYRLAGIVDITIERVLFAVMILTLLGGLVSTPSILRGNRSIEPLFLLLCAICLASMLVHGFTPSSPKYTSPWYIFITAYLFPMIVFLFAKRYFVTERNLSILFHGLFYLGAYLSVMAFFEFFNLRQYVFPRFINDPKVWLHLDRARGPFLNSAMNGLALVVSFLCGVHLLAFKNGFRRLIHLFLMSLFFPAVFFTLTRSVYLCFLLSLGTLLFAYRTSFPKWKVLALPLAVTLVIASANVPRLASSDRRAGGVYQIEEVRIREALLKRSMVMILDNPIFGVGLAQFIPVSVAKYKGVVPIPETSEEQTQHNQVISITVELGLVGVAVYLAIVTMFFRRAFSLLHASPETEFIDRNLAVLIGAALGAYVVNNLFIDSSFQLFPNVLFFMFGGIADGLYGRTKLMNTIGREWFERGSFDILVHNS